MYRIAPPVARRRLALIGLKPGVLFYIASSSDIGAEYVSTDQRPHARITHRRNSSVANTPSQTRNATIYGFHHLLTDLRCATRRGAAERFVYHGTINAREAMDKVFKYGIV